jgi:AMP-activated protein kinase-like protein
MTSIDVRLQEALDGDRDPMTLPPDLREAYERLVRAAGMLQDAPVASVAERVMAEVRRAPPRAFTVRLRPLWTLALAAALGAMLLLPAEESVAPGAEEGIAQFVGHFPGARSVDVVGSFNDWRPGALPLRDENHDGIWHGAVVLPAGQHEYMFVVDGERWVADPLAGRYVDDGFGGGRENAVLIVRP